MGQKCVHCGEDCGNYPVIWQNKAFCCNGCKTVYQLLNENQLYTYYEIEDNPGIKIQTEDFGNKYAYLDNEEIKEKIYDFSEGNFRKVTFYIPAIHCSSCIWLLENLNTLNKGITHSLVNFVKKEVSISFNEKEISLRQLVELLASIHYIPQITLEKIDKSKSKKSNKKLLLKIGVAGFAFGNTMLLSFPEYIKGSFGIEEKYEIVFGLLNFLFAIPVLFYSGSDYLLSAWKNLKHKIINIDLPIAIGMLAIFLQSTYEIFSRSGAGYMDSLTGFVFFLLVGKWYQSRTYQALSFDRDYKSYFPVAVTKLVNGKEESILLEKLQKGDTILVHNQELIPADAVLKKGTANIDYSFVTGESKPVQKKEGDMLYAGGRQIGSSIELEVQSKVEQSQLTKLWNQDDHTRQSKNLSTVIDKVSKYFTGTIISIAALTAIYWWISDASIIMKAFTAVLIVACPCALALSIPFTYGNMQRLLGKKGFYLKNPEVIERLAKIDTIVFDKTGTITQNNDFELSYTGTSLNKEEKIMLKSLCRHSTHPLSTAIYNSLEDFDFKEVNNYRELPARGLIGEFGTTVLKIGSAEFTKAEKTKNISGGSVVYISFNNAVKGMFVIKTKYRKGLKDLINRLSLNYELHLISGDNEREKENLLPLFKNEKLMHFNQSPQDKLNYIKNLQKEGKNVLMIGDGLNDAGALKASNTSISIADNVYHFSPACDAILDAREFNKLPTFLKWSNQTIKIIKMSFVFSLLYNLIGMYFALTGQLSPIVAAILMPLSSITIVVFVTVLTNWISVKEK
ncbi:MAG: heavy metal translocating P-type ATPase metal-binding domain-containing protein [Bacteroidales bacterium]|nr:heavy metal translocating P-type ATPase metal-binding domain-containing protein [Bacteroidales bacterium]